MTKQRILLLQAAYYLLTGLWPIVHISSFMAVTGPKTDIWLVKMVGLLTTAIAGALLAGRHQINRPFSVLVIGAAVSYALIDVYYYFNGKIRAVYLIDAVIEIAIVVLYLVSRDR